MSAYISLLPEWLQLQLYRHHHFRNLNTEIASVLYEVPVSNVPIQYQLIVPLEIQKQKSCQH